MKIKTDRRRHSTLASFSEYYIPDELDQVNEELDRQKILANYRQRAS